MSLKNLALALGAVIAITSGAHAADNVRVRGTVSAIRWLDVDRKNP